MDLGWPRGSVPPPCPRGRLGPVLVGMGWDGMGREGSYQHRTLADPGLQTISSKQCLCRLPHALPTVATHDVLLKLLGYLLGAHVLAP